MSKIINKLKLKPERVLVLGIAVVMLVGGILLNLPISSVNGESIGFINALFTATSATSVTGLVVVNTAEHWTLFGKVVIICLIQVGGLGFMTLTTLIALIMGKKIGLRDRLIMQEELNQFSLSGIVTLTKYVIKATAVIELTGAAILSTRLVPEYGFATGIAYSLFHAISAFCNAGFDLFGTSLVEYVGDPIIILTICLLIVLGGLGYTVYLDVTRRKARGFRSLTLNSKMAITITLFLIVGGTLFILIAEHKNPETLKNLAYHEKFFAALMQSVTTRTAGFNSIDLGATRAATAFIMIILMFIGGSPSSTAGGIKTTTFGTLMLSVVSIIRGKTEVEAFNRSIPKHLILRALAVFFVSAGLVVVVIITLTITEQQGFLDIVYEVVSAFSTCGVTRGITDKLSDIGKITVLLTMFIGKVGPLTLALAIAKRTSKKEEIYKFPEGKPIIG